MVTEGCLSRYSDIFSLPAAAEAHDVDAQGPSASTSSAQVSLGEPEGPKPPSGGTHPALPAPTPSQRVGQAAARRSSASCSFQARDATPYVKVTQGYIANQILHVSWCEFQARLASVGDLEEILRAHAEYLHKAVFR